MRVRGARVFGSAGRVYDAQRCHKLSARAGRGKMAKHHPDLIMCRKQPGIAIGRLCEKCDGKCVICDSYVRSGP